MSELESRLAGFRRRVRLLQAWRGLARGAMVGGAVALSLAALDYFQVWYSGWLGVAVPILAGGLVGALYGFTRKVSTSALADSIDRRAQLQNRVATAAEEHHEQFAEAQRQDALARLGGLKPAKVYPIRFTRWHTGSLALSLAAAVVVLLGNTPALLSAQERQNREELKEAGRAIERVAKPVLEKPDEESTKAAKELAQKYDAFGKDLQRGRMPMEKAMEEANKLAAEAERATKEQAERAELAVAKAQDALLRDAFEDAAREAGMNPADFADLSQAEMQALSQLSDAEAAAQESDLSRQLAEMAQQLREGKNEKGESMSQAERDALAKQMDALKKDLQNLQLSKKAREFLNRLMNDPDYKELMKLAQELRKASQAAQQNPDRPPLTKEQIEEMNRKLEELAERLKNDEDLKAFIEQLKQALKECEGQCDSGGMCMSLGGLLPMWGPSGPGQDQLFRDIGQVPQNEQEEDIQAKADVKVTKGQRQEKGDETYMEIKGPASIGDRSKTPYFKVMPKYRKQAEEALNKEQIPKEHQKRVRDYFDSLNRGKP